MSRLHHETLFGLAALLLSAAGFLSTEPTPFTVALAVVGAGLAALGIRAQGRELATLPVRVKGGEL